MAADPLDPPFLLRTVGVLETAKALLIDVVRGRPVTQEEVLTIRQGAQSVRAVLDALDALHPWVP